MKWSKEAEEKLVGRYAEDGPKVLAEELQTTTWAVVAKARRMKLETTRKNPPKGFQWTREMVETVKQRYVEEGAEKLASEFGVTTNTVYRKASRLGLHTIAGHAVAGQRRAEKSTSCDIHYFDQWTPNMAYILGFLFADGSIHKKLGSVNIAISSKDEEILVFIQRELKCKTPIYHREGYIDKRGSLTQPQSILVISSTVLVKRLIALGLKPRKTYNNDPFPEVPEEMLPHFIRGYLDGDGTTCITKGDACFVGFVGSPEFIIGLRRVLTNIGMSSHKIQFRGKITPYAYAAWSALQDIRTFFEFAYPEGYGFCLLRKKENLVKWLSKERWSRGHYYGKRITS